jgi:hypothetical protein
MRLATRRHFPDDHPVLESCFVFPYYSVLLWLFSPSRLPLLLLPFQSGGSPRGRLTFLAACPTASMATHRPPESAPVSAITGGFLVARKAITHPVSVPAAREFI